MSSFRHDGGGLADPRAVAAQGWARKGWPVFPLDGKRPRVKWQDAATTDPARIRELWRKHPGSNIGVPTGARSGVFVLDVDGAAGRASLATLERQHGQLPKSYRVRSGRGEHLYFRAVEGLRNRAGAWPGIDVRGEGGLVVVAGSLHASGATYDAEDDRASVAAAPAWLLAALERSAGTEGATDRSVGVEPPVYAAAAMASELADLAQAEAGSRNDRLNAAAFALGRLVGAGHLDEDSVRSELLRVAARIGLAAAEARPTIRSGMSKGMEEPAFIVRRTGNAEAPDELEAEIAKEEHRITVREEARRRVLAKRADEDFRPLRRISLKDALAGDRPDEPPTLISGLHRQGYNTTITARYKTGKTTLGANLLRSLADGDPFLDRFSVVPPGGRIGLLNYETTETDMLEWLEKSGIQNTDRIAVENLRGHPFGLAAERNRQELVDWCREMSIEVLLLDPHRMAFAGFGKEIDNDDVNRFTATLDEIKAEARVSDLFLFVHTGRGEADQGAERARGATALDDWVDQRWALAKSKEPDDETRFFYADGRLPYVPEFKLDYDPATRRLSAEEGNRRGQASDRSLKELLNVLGARGSDGANTAELLKLCAIPKRQEKAFSELLRRTTGNGHLFRRVGGLGKETRYWLPVHAPEARS